MCRYTQALTLGTFRDYVVKASLGPSFCPYCEEGSLGRELNDTHWHRVFLCLFPQRNKVDFVSKLGRRLRHN